MKSIDIKGKKYVTVNERLLYFRENFKGYTLTSNIYELTEDRVVMEAVITDPNDRIVATGYAYEDKDSTFINKTSFIENCETSAWGRALANFGIGIEESVASADEVVTAIAQQDDKPWLNDKDFKSNVELLNRETDPQKRKAHVETLYQRYKVNREHRGQLDDLLNQSKI